MLKRGPPPNKRMVRTEEEMTELLRRLQVDGRVKNSWPGLVLLEEFPELRLEKGFRIVEAGRVTDIWALGELELPVELTSFDCKGEHGLNLLCPLFDVVGFNIEMLALDVMHVIDLGIAQYLVGTVFRELIESNVCLSSATHKQKMRFDNLSHLRRRLSAYYQTMEKARGTMSAIGRLTIPMIGPLAKPRLSAKAADTRN